MGGNIVSRKTVRWRRLAQQAGEERVHLLVPRRATGMARFRSTELEGYVLEKAFGKVCTHPMRDDKRARFEKVIQSAAKPIKKGWK
jgi:hypothetical protein